MGIVRTVGLEVKRAQILETARAVLYKPTCDPENGCSCCNPDDIGMFEYLDGALAELVAEAKAARPPAAAS